MSIHVLGIAGSLRAESFNAALIETAVELAPDGMEIRRFTELAALPLFNQDIEAAGDPAAVQVWKAAIREADALLIATPEYNYGVPGVLKNAIDWASRPPGKSALQRKPLALMGASPGAFGTAHAQQSLRYTFVATETYVMPRPEVFVARAHEKINGGRVIDERTRTHIRALLESFALWVRRMNVAA